MKNIVVTGASQRLGLYLTKEYSAAGNKIFAITRKASKELKALEGNDVVLIEVNSYSKSAADNAISVIRSMTNRLDVLINNASYFVKDETAPESEELFTAFYETHMLFPYQLIVGAQDLLKSCENPGVIVNLTDIFAVNPNSDYSMYCSTKAGLANLSLSFSKKFKGTIRVNNIAPGPIKFLPTHGEQDKSNILQQSIIQREGGFLPILKTINFIIDNDYLIGTTINVDGGRSINTW